MGSRLRADPCPSYSRLCSPSVAAPPLPLQEPGCGKSRPGSPTLCLGFPRRPPCLRRGEPSQDGAVPAVCWPSPEVPSAAPAGPQPCWPGHHTHTSLHHAAADPGAVCSAQTPGALTKGPGLCCHSPTSPAPSLAELCDIGGRQQPEDRQTAPHWGAHGALLPQQPQFHCGPEQPHPGGLERSPHMCPWGHTVFQTPSLQSPPRAGRAPSAELGPLPPLTFTLPPPGAP